MLRSTRTRWGALSQLLHWLIAALIGVQITLGLIGTALPLSMTKLATLALHSAHRGDDLA
jgi:cytochrome b561